MFVLMTLALLADSNDITVRFAFARVGTVPYVDAMDEKKLSGEKYLAVAIQIVNHSETRKLDYHGAGVAGLAPLASLRDEHGNAYKAITFGPLNRVVLQQRNGSVYPGKHLIDLYVFEPPVAAAKEFTLTIKGQAFSFGGDAVVKFRADEIGLDKAAEAAPKKSAPADPAADHAVIASAPKKPAKPAKSPEERAAGMLKAAQQFTGEERAKWLRKVISQFPDTKAAGEAKRLLASEEE